MVTRVFVATTLLLGSFGVFASGMIQPMIKELLVIDSFDNRVHLRVIDSNIECVDVSFAGVDIEFDCGWLQVVENPDLKNLKMLTQKSTEGTYHQLEIPFFTLAGFEGENFEFIAMFRDGVPDQIFIQERSSYPYEPIHCIVGDCWDDSNSMPVLESPDLD